MLRMSRVMAAGLALGLAGCSSSGRAPAGPGGGQACPAGQVMTAGSCVAAQECAGTVCGSACCAAGEACVAPGRCEASGSGCASDADCGGDLACLAGSCQMANRACTFKPPKGAFTPRVAWQWTSSTVQPEYVDVLTTPVVVPLVRPPPDSSSAPAVVFNTILSDRGAGSAVPGVMRAVSGWDGSELWTTDPAHPVNGLAGIAAGDLDGTGHTTFVTGRLPLASAAGTARDPAEDGLVAFADDGTFRWEVKGLYVYWGAPSIANLYGGDEAQVILGATVIDAHGQIVCQGAFGIGENFLGPISTVADVNLDGSPDIVTGNTVYDNHCQPEPGWPNGQPDGLVAVADFTGDTHPEIVVVSAGTVRMQDWQGNVIWGPVAIPGGGAGGGAPTIADFDGDGQLEIGVAGRFSYTVFKPFAADPVLWTRATQDESAVTGSSVFDFEHDGRAEVVYGDECYTRVYDGPTGQPLFEAPNPSCTVHELPVIADVDTDGRAEIVVATNSVCKKTCPWGPHIPDDPATRRHGVTVYKELRDRWVSTRAVWNEHAYHVTNVGDDGSIPRSEPANWTAIWNGERLNDFRANTIGDPDYRAPDLAVRAQDAAIDSSGCPEHLRLKVNVWNRGAVLVSAGVPVTLYVGAAGGQALAVAHTAGTILPGESETVTFDLPIWDTAPAATLTVVLDDDGSGQGVVGECDRTNDAVSVPVVICPRPAR
jgi:hypothetical protein